MITPRAVPALLPHNRRVAPKPVTDRNDFADPLGKHQDRAPAPCGSGRATGIAARAEMTRFGGYGFGT